MDKIKIFQEILKEHRLDFIFRDKMGILTRRKHSDNIEYILKTNNSCDALPMMEALNDMITNSNICIDIGANIGITSVWLAKNSKKVYAFEPEEKNIIRFREQMSLNNIENVELSEMIVSDSSDIKILHIFESYGHHSLSPYHVTDKVGEIQVQSVTLDEFCNNKDIDQIDCLKVDVEGFELEVFHGSKKKLQNKSIKVIIFEHSPVLLRKQNRNIEDVMLFLNKYGYRVFTLNHKEINYSDIKDLGQEDLYAIAK
ncbi:MAG: FkbM family methyltransferase [Aliarcobacter skirrowii]|uniref:FkbM family methyltransferase n=1 Tax=Aliarcobacter skirrowii TaxID=28200 RepID=UPI00242A9844|nr:FkbM family methyltransferase [Aliarcobacter skirrowii]MDD2509166.1 FkbM family methyltransferase [Aliarcobacter skirrowii]MDD3496537.1 FkbM family methyltransferase [Aliarcobacter skirrowii]